MKNKLKKVILIGGLLLNIPIFTACNSNTKVIENDNQKKTSETEVPSVSESSIVNERVIKTEAQTPTPTINKTVMPISSPEINSNDMTIDYVLETKNEINDLLNKIDESDIKEKIFAKFIKLTDFIFCDGEINGVKFNELDDITKQKIKALVTDVDMLIDSKIPGYKDNLKDSYNQVKEYIKNSETVNEVKEKAGGLKEDAKDKIDEITGHDNTVDEFVDGVKKDTSDVLNGAKDIYNNVKDNLKENHGEDYEKAKQKVKDKYDSWSSKYRK